MTLIAAVSGLAFGLALALLGAFFATKNELLDRLAEWAFVLFAILAVPTMVAVAGRLPDGGAATWIVTGLGIVSVVAIGLGELATNLRLVDFRRISAALTAAFAGFMAWVGGVSALALATGELPALLGWLGIAAIAVGLAFLLLMVRQPGMLSGEREPGPIQMGGVLVSMAAVVAWLVWLGFLL